MGLFENWQITFRLLGTEDVVLQSICRLNETMSKNRKHYTGILIDVMLQSILKPFTPALVKETKTGITVNWTNIKHLKLVIVKILLLYSVNLDII